MINPKEFDSYAARGKSALFRGAPTTVAMTAAPNFALAGSAIASTHK